MALANSILNQFGIKHNQELPEGQMDKFIEALKFGYNLFERPSGGDGYLIRSTEEIQSKKTTQSKQEGQPEVIKEGEQTEEEKNNEAQIKAVEKKIYNYFEFTPMLFSDMTSSDKHIVEEFGDYDDALRTYFDNLTILGVVGFENEEAKIWKKYENIREDQEGRIKQIKDGQEDNFLKANLIEHNINEISAIIEIINSLIEIGMTSVIKGVISQAKKLGDPLANIIKSYNIQERKVTLYLGDENDEEAKMKIVDININQSPYENAKRFYDLRNNLIEKEKKTSEAANTVLKQAKNAAEKKMKKKEEGVKAIKINRRTYWYEKFYWFISSENYLVVSARDAHQNELLIKKYLAKDDLVFHTQVQGSAFSIIKNPKGDEIPQITLDETATATL